MQATIHSMLQQYKEYCQYHNQKIYTQFEELVNLKSDTIRLLDNTKVLIDTTTKCSSKLIEQDKCISSLTTYFE